MVGSAFWTTKPRQLLGACPTHVSTARYYYVRTLWRHLRIYLETSCRRLGYRDLGTYKSETHGSPAGPPHTSVELTKDQIFLTQFFKIETGRLIYRGHGTLEDQVVANVKLATDGSVPEAWSNFCPKPQSLTGSESKALTSHDTKTAVEPDIDQETAWNKLAEDHGHGACDPRLLGLIRRMFALRPEDRPTMEEVLEDIYMADVI